MSFLSNAWDYFVAGWYWLVDVLDGHEGAITAAATVVIAAFTIALAKYTKRLGAAAIKQDARMRESIRISKNATKLSEAALVASERAFVFCTGIHAQYSLIANTSLFEWRLRPQWRNSGNTPTKNLRLFVNCLVLGTPLPEGFDFTLQHMDAGNGLIPPQSSLFGGFAPTPPHPAITPQDILEAQEGRKFIYVYGWVRYFDVFPNSVEHITRFCYQTVPLGDPRADDANKELRWDSFHHREGNCADDECS